jgi:small subunit ribosomal protein S17
MAENETPKNEKNTRVKRLSGVVVESKAKDTATVSVTRYTKHRKYGKFIKRSKKYLAHDPGNTHEIGQKVVIEEVKPISKRKSFKVV